MSIYARPRAPHAIQDLREAEANRRLICEVRGYCGPFINEEYYSLFPDPMWQGTGECVVCCSTRNVKTEEEKRRAVEAHATPVHAPAPLPPASQSSAA